MKINDFDDPSFLKEINVKAEDLLSQLKNDIFNNSKFKIVRMRMFEKLWSNRINKNKLFSLVIKESDIELIDLKNLNLNFEEDIFEALKFTNYIEINNVLKVTGQKNCEFTSSKDAKRFYKDCSKEGVVVAFFGKDGVDYFVRGENLGETNLFYCSEDLTRFSEKKDISQIFEVLQSYEQTHLSNQSEYMVFFADNSTLRRIDPALIRRNILRNKPEKYMRDHLRNFLNERMRHTFGIEIELSASKRELDLFTEVNGEFYFFEIKWLGQSISDCGTKLSTSYGDARAREGVTQTLEYIEELLTNMGNNVRAGYLILFDARDDKQDIDFKGYSFVRSELRPYLQLFSLAPSIKLIKRHPA
ncbi:hypothetical protein G8C92_28035 [Paenibacillus donghaensis]|uniref:hypothetical protein n=1 Tax=Paenibacillus donghaensis TaxID=414771 RepID=UPI0018837A7D|nr:hypothetical protein [Paenibacillus donghaensis]MBE9917855.1 hypothetical protein [Paenibacillus donghaensis]